MPTPYADHVGHHDPLDVLRTSIHDYRSLLGTFTPAKWRTPWQPGKWTAQQILVHVTQWEMIFSIRVRCAVGVPNYVVQPLDQDDLMRTEGTAVDGPTAFAAFDAVRRMNLEFIAALSGDERRMRVRHEVRGEIDVEDLLTTLAGHGVHHLKQLQGM